MKFLGFTDMMKFSVFGLYENGVLVGRHYHFNTPQVYEYNNSDPYYPQRTYISGAFRNGRFTDSEIEYIFQELDEKYNVRKDSLVNSITRFISYGD